MARKDRKGRNLRTGESQRKDGIYMYRYTDEKAGVRRAIYDADLKSLREKERQITREQQDGIITTAKEKRLTVNTLFERYMESLKLAESTRANYFAIWKNQVSPVIGQMRVVQVRSSDIKLLYSSLTKQGYSHSTIKLIHNLIYPCFEMAVGDDIIRKNPAKAVLKDQGKAPKKKKLYPAFNRKNSFLSWNRVTYTKSICQCCRLCLVPHVGVEN